MVITKVGVLSFAKIYGAMGVLMGLVMGVVIAAVAGIGSAVASSQYQSPATVLGFGAGFGIAGIIVLPILYGCATFLTGLVGGAIYNAVAHFVGGLEIETN